MIRTVRESSTTEKFDDEPCRKCNHPRGVHGIGYCWAAGLVDPKCRKKCTGFVRDNLIFLERELKRRCK